MPGSLPRHGWIDAHCHLSDLAGKTDLSAELDHAAGLGITGFLSCASDECQVRWHRENRVTGALWLAGIHPWNVTDNSDFLSVINALCREGCIAGIGEIGLDGLHPNPDRQHHRLKLQLDIATQYDLPVVFHCVGGTNDLIRILRHDFPRIRGTIHSFGGSPQIIEALSGLDIGFSFHRSIVYRKHARETITTAVRLGRCCFETDSPYRGEPSDGEVNPLSSLLRTIVAISRKADIPEETLADCQSRYLSERYPGLY